MKAAEAPPRRVSLSGGGSGAGVDGPTASRTTPAASSTLREACGSVDVLAMTALWKARRNESSTCDGGGGGGAAATGVAAVGTPFCSSDGGSTAGAATAPDNVADAGLGGWELPVPPLRALLSPPPLAATDTVASAGTTDSDAAREATVATAAAGAVAVRVRRATPLVGLRQEPAQRQ